MSVPQSNNPVMNGPSDAVRQLEQRRKIWREKYPLRACYANWHEMLKPWIVPGRTLEVGGGAALMKEIWEGDLISTDILPTPWVDFTLDAQEMNLDEASMENILCVDALHHFPDPHQFLKSAARVLKDHGRVLMIEPWITPVSRFYYGLMHHERVDFSRYHSDPDVGKDPWDGNMAVPTMLFGRERAQWENRHPTLKIECLQKFSFFDFQFAGGFKPWALVRSPRLYSMLLSMDRRLAPLMPMIAFRAMIVLQRAPR